MLIRWLSDFIPRYIMVGQHLFFWHWREQKLLPKVIKLSVLLRTHTTRQPSGARIGHRFGKSRQTVHNIVTIHGKK